MTAQVSLARLREFGITPDRDLGQHFLIDSNVLEVAGRLIELDPSDVVLEVGAGVGVLTEWLAERVSVVHAIEIDRRLEPALRATIGERANVRLQIADALDVDIAGLHPAPTAMVANLPYAVATPVVMTALPLVPRFCVMVQRELADRFFASPGTKAYGAPSVLIQIACERRGLRKVSRTVFVPEPNVDSALVAFSRRDEFRFARSGSGSPGSCMPPSAIAERRWQTHSSWPSCRFLRQMWPACAQSSSRRSGSSPWRSSCGDRPGSGQSQSGAAGGDAAR